MNTCATNGSYDDLITNIKTNLNNLEVKDKITRIKVIEDVKDEIMKALKTGSKIDDVLQVLNSCGMEIQKNTLRVYLNKIGINKTTTKEN